MIFLFLITLVYMYIVITLKLNIYLFNAQHLSYFQMQTIYHKFLSSKQKRLPKQLIFVQYIFYDLFTTQYTKSTSERFTGYADQVTTIANIQLFVTKKWF